MEFKGIHMESTWNPYGTVESTLPPRFSHSRCFRRLDQQWAVPSHSLAFSSPMFPQLQPVGREHQVWGGEQRHGVGQLAPDRRMTAHCAADWAADWTAVGELAVLAPSRRLTVHRIADWIADRELTRIRPPLVRRRLRLVKHHVGDNRVLEVVGGRRGRRRRHEVVGGGRIRRIHGQHVDVVQHVSEHWVLKVTRGRRGRRRRLVEMIYVGIRGRRSLKMIDVGIGVVLLGAVGDNAAWSELIIVIVVVVVDVVVLPGSTLPASATPASASYHGTFLASAAAVSEHPHARSVSDPHRRFCTWNADDVTVGEIRDAGHYHPALEDRGEGAHVLLEQVLHQSEYASRHQLPIGPCQGDQGSIQAVLDSLDKVQLLSKHLRR
mmetsp:Transcript_25068/g.41965  ORF Transcript_25068/g.41965 Transcript_25068/m.41965 type:complete len:379 (+) Transcript_25068:507-1643(+)